jgi:hypothetical protein
MSKNGGKVGIGTANPNEALTVIGNINLTGNITSGTGTVYIDGSNSKVGIGTTTPAGNLDVDGSFYTGTGSILVDPQDGSNEGGEFRLLGAGSNEDYYIDNYAGNMRFVESAGSETAVMTLESDGDAYMDATTTFFVDASANSVGIGDATPTGKLQVVGDEVRIGNAGTVNYASSDGDLYVERYLEVDSNFYGQNIYGSVITPSTYADLSIEVKTNWCQDNCQTSVSCTSGKYIIYGHSGNRDCPSLASSCNGPYCTPGASSCIGPDRGGDGSGVYIVCAKIS